MSDRTGEVWTSGGVVYVCLGEDPADVKKYQFQQAGAERKVSITKISIDYFTAVQGESPWWRKLS